MTLQEITEKFGTTEGYFYILTKNKKDIEILEDIDQTASTLANSSGMFIRTENEVTHPDYVRITE